ncbi:recombinase family protein [Aerococcaceae bacterium NML190938]|nr:recombinase family protein [Aerococcaceae bacterium NML190938]
MEQAGVEKSFSEQVRGKNLRRKELHKLLQFAREEGEFVITSLDKLGRNYNDILEFIGQLHIPALA